MKIIEVEKGLAMYLVQYTGMVKEYSTTDQNSLINYFIQLKEEIMEKFNVSFQIFNSKYVISKDQLKLVLHQVYSSFSQKSNISKQFGVEFLLYLSQERQITKAIEKVGIKISIDVNEISFGEILFGEPDNLKLSIKFLENKINISKHSQFKYLESNEWQNFMETYEISIDHITNILRGNNHSLKGKIKSLDHLKELISSDSIRKAITDAYNIGMVNLFLENFKRNEII